MFGQNRRTELTASMRTGSRHRSAQEDVQLSGVLDEFRTALRAEIEAASREAATSAVSLVNGHRIAQVGAAYQYRFQIESPLNLPGDAPGDLLLPGRGPVETTVISVEGLSITLSVPKDLGAFVPSAHLRSDLTFLMRRLIDRIEALAGSPNPVGERIRGAEPVSGEPAAVQVDHRLNLEQQKAVASSLGRDTTFIWGPPGTGKTETIGAIGRELHSAGRSVLLVSHTNIAVDEAVLKIGPTLTAEELTRGDVLRVGEPQDPRLRDHNAELRLKTHVDRRAAVLAERREHLTTDRKSSLERAVALARSIDICEWVAEARGDVERMEADLSDLQRLEQGLEHTRGELARLEAETDKWRVASSAAHRAQEQEAQRQALADRGMVLEASTRRLEAEKQESQVVLAREEQLLSQAERLEPLRSEAHKLPTVATQKQSVADAHRAFASAQQTTAGIAARLEQAEDLYEQSSSCGKLVRMWHRLPDPEEQRGVVAGLQSEAASADGIRERLQHELASAERTLSEVMALHEELVLSDSVPDAVTQQRTVEERRADVDRIVGTLSGVQQSFSDAQGQLAQLSAQIEEFTRAHAATPDEIIRGAAAHRDQTRKLQSQVGELAERRRSDRRQLEETALNRLAVLEEWGLTAAAVGSAEAMLGAVRAAYSAAPDEVRGMEVSQLRAERDEINEHIRSIDAEIRTIEDALKRVEELVIADAKVIATTLTRAYLRDAIHTRRFDTVILDEASIAPIPALWVAASRADNNAVVVGDFRQLPPIVISQNELAQKWLGRDVFEAAGMLSYTGNGDHFIALRRQYRMHPDISAIPNALMYDQLLTDDPLTENDGGLGDWYAGHDDAVLLVDTGPVHAWVTSVPRGRGASRLNFLSATICVDIAEQLLKNDRETFSADSRPRILIICPYRAHATLMALLLREQELVGEVAAGTVHNFQGSEADVVILDLVNDEPHWRVGMFMPERDEATRRLLNVALTRARRRLIVVGDFDYAAKLSKNAFIGARMLPYLQERYRQQSALEIVPAGLAARAAKSMDTVLEGDVEPDASRLVVSQEQFYPLLRGDIARADRRVVIYSPFLTQHRLGWLEPHLRAAADRGVDVCVVTRALADRGKRELAEYRMLEAALRNWGVTVLHKRLMHEKLVFVDDEVLWSGSLNPLSFSNTQEIMERRVSQRVSQDYASKLRLNEVLAACVGGNPRCDVCGFEMVLGEGRRELYWRCMNSDCGYSRDFDAPAAQHGLITCGKCGGRVEFGEWGANPSWRCLTNRRHHQKIARAHLLLPKMRGIIPSRELGKLDRRFGIEPGRIRFLDQPDLFGAGSE